MNILSILIIGALGVFILTQTIGFIKDVNKRNQLKKDKINSENKVETNNED